MARRQNRPSPITWKTSAIGETYFVEDPIEKQRFVIEMGIESTRNPRVAEIFLGVDNFCRSSFQGLFQRLKDEGRIAPKIDIATLAEVFHVIGDGLFWRRAIMPGYDARPVLPAVTEIIGNLVNPVGPSAVTHNVTAISISAHKSKIEAAS